MRWCPADHGHSRPENCRPRPGTSWADTAGAAGVTRLDTVTVTVRISVSGSGGSGRAARRAGPSHPATLLFPLRSDQTRRAAELAAAVRSGLGQVLARAEVTWARIRSAYALLAAEPEEPPASWMCHYLTHAGNLLFAGKDREAGWHAWDVERRDAGLGRAYRDPRFDTLASCPRCHSVSTTADGTVCRQCSAADRLIRAETTS